MKAYMYQAALYCEPCGLAIKARIDSDWSAKTDAVDAIIRLRAQLRDHGLAAGYDDVTRRVMRAFGMPRDDSGSYPQGPYSDGGGESDTPTHCDACGAFLQNGLTGDGYEYVAEAIEAYANDGRGDKAVVRLWCDHYGIEMMVAGWNMPGYLPEIVPAVFAGKDAQKRANAFIEEEKERYRNEGDRENEDQDPYVYWADTATFDDVFGREDTRASCPQCGQREPCQGGTLCYHPQFNDDARGLAQPGSKATLLETVVAQCAEPWIGDANSVRELLLRAAGAKSL